MGIFLYNIALIKGGILLPAGFEPASAEHVTA
jgi:hypothetical protein